MRALLDAHSDVRCGEETHIIPIFIDRFKAWVFKDIGKHRLLEAGLDDDILMTAGSYFILELIVRHGEPAKRLCNKDPFVLKNAQVVSTMFPNTKFIYMIRDGRAVVHSIITRKVGIANFNATTYRSALVGWNNITIHMNNECEAVGVSLSEGLLRATCPSSRVIHETHPGVSGFRVGLCSPPSRRFRQQTGRNISFKVSLHIL